MKQFNTKRLGTIIAVALLAVTQFIGGAKSPGKALKSNVDKADYIFLEALKYESMDSADAYFEMISRAYELNPDDGYVGYDVGLYNVILHQYDDSLSVERGLGLMRRYANENPTDEEAGLRLANIYGMLSKTDDAMSVYRMVYENAKDPRVSGSAFASALAYTGVPDSIRKAIGILDELEKIEGVSIELLGQKIKFYDMLGDTASVLGEANRILLKNPNSVPYLITCGNLYRHYNRPDSAMAYFNKALSIEPGSGAALYSRANLYLEMGDSASFDREIFEALRLPDLEVEDKIGILQEYVNNLYTDSTQHDRINSLFESLESQYPYESEVHRFYGSYLYYIGDKAGAADQINYAVSLSPDQRDLWEMLVQIYYFMDEFHKADVTIGDALKYFPSDLTFYQLGSSVNLKSGNYDKAETYINKALEVVDSTESKAVAELYGSLGDIAFHRKDMKKARELYDIALSHDSLNSLLLNNVAYYMATENEDLEKAQEYIKTAIALEEASESGNSANTLDTYAWVLFKLKDYPKAYEVINQVLELDNEDSSSEVYEHAGDIYFMNGHPDEALEFWEKALSLDPDNDLLKRKVKNKTFFFE